MHVTIPAFGKQLQAESPGLMGGSGGALVGKLGPASDPLEVPGIPGRPLRVPVKESNMKLSKGGCLVFTGQNHHTSKQTVRSKKKAKEKTVLQM